MSGQRAMTTALILIAHGSRNADANEDLFALAKVIRHTEEFACVEASFLEIAEPTIEAAGRQCAASGAQRIVLSPYFLSAGIHVRRDLQNHRDRLAIAFPELEIILAEPFGRHPLLAEIVLNRTREAMLKSDDGGKLCPIS
jgi:sirohydrochlorin ferrochelatase